MFENFLIIKVPDSYLLEKVDLILTHEMAAAAPKFLEDYKQGESKESGSGYYVNGRVVHDTFVFDKKKSAVYLACFCYFFG